MKHKFLRLFGLFLLIPLLTSCDYIRANIIGMFYKNPYAFSIGYGNASEEYFNYYLDIKVGIRSDKLEHNIQNGLALTMGVGNTRVSLSGSYHEKSIIVLYARYDEYLANEDKFDYKKAFGDDYYIFDIASIDEFCSDKFSYSVDVFHGTTYNYETEITIPYEVIYHDNNFITPLALSVLLLDYNDKQGYYSRAATIVGINYKIVDKYNVVLTSVEYIS